MVRTPRRRRPAWSLVQPLPDALDPNEKDEVKGDCLDLLLILSEAMDPAEGLKILDRAARLVPEPTVGDHLLRAAFLAQTGDVAGRVREEQLAAKLTPSTAFDHLLIGREQSARGQNRDAIHSSLTAIRLDPDQLGAHLMLARLYFNTQRYSEAKNSLNTCIRTAPELAGSLPLPRPGLRRARESGAARDQRDSARAAEWQLEAAESFSGRRESTISMPSNCGPTRTTATSCWSIGAGCIFKPASSTRRLPTSRRPFSSTTSPTMPMPFWPRSAQRQGRLDEAALALDRAIERQPDRPELFRARALLVARPA